MPVETVASDNLAANATDVNVLAGLEISQIDPSVRAASIRLLAVASAAGLTHRLVIGPRTPLKTGRVDVSTTPTQIIDPDNLVISGVRGYRAELIRLFVSETAGAATTDYLARLVVSELG